ncbi:MAG: sigma 54-interacting transcriptional regulator [Oscillospiraceae bacterium]|nr:sigma 54-interacting transcriptional regulator [Oscillospiraceae bacterium]
MDCETEESLEARTLRAFMEGDFSGIVRVDRQGRVTDINDRARSLLDCRHRDVNGVYVRDLFPLLDEELLSDVIRQGDSVANCCVQNRVARYAVNMEPVMNGDDPAGAVIFLQKLPIPAKATGERTEYSITSNRYFSEFDTASGAFLRAVKLLKYTAQQDQPILLVGEDGTEIPALAKCIHNESSRRKNGYAEVECDALSTEQVSHLLFDQASEPEDGGLNRSMASIQGARFS